MNLKKRVAIFSDIHWGLYKNQVEWLELTKTWGEYFIKRCKELGVEQVLFLGDYFHHRDEIDVQTFQYGVEFLKKLSDNFPVVMITGNHDCYLKETSEIHSLQSFKEWDRITVLDKYTHCNYGGKNISFVPWGCDIEHKDLDYVFGHFEIVSFKFSKYSTECKNGLDPLAVLNKTKKIFSGHFHMNDEKVFKGRTITYIGSPFQHNFGDVGNNNGFYVLDFSTDEYNFIPNESFPQFKKIKFSQIKDEIKTITNDFVKLVLDEETTDKKLEKILDVLRLHGVKDIQFENEIEKISVDKSKLSDKIESFNIESFINEFIDTLDIEDALKGRVKEKSNNLYKGKIL
jgi:DNA repair exonuclease SbcCD nuclease subunit